MQDQAAIWHAGNQGRVRAEERWQHQESGGNGSELDGGPRRGHDPKAVDAGTSWTLPNTCERKHHGGPEIR